MAKRCNVKRIMAEAVKWGKRDARINSISPGIIATLFAIDEFNGERGDFYRNMLAKSPAGRPVTADEVANLAQFANESARRICHRLRLSNRWRFDSIIFLWRIETEEAIIRFILLTGGTPKNEKYYFQVSISKAETYNLV